MEYFYLILKLEAAQNVPLFLLLIFKIVAFMCMGVLPACLSVHYLHAQRSKEGIGSPRIRIAGGCDLSDMGVGNQT